MNIFSELYGTYFRIAAKLLENAATDEKTVRDTVLRDGFRDSVLFLPQKLLPGEESWGLLSRGSDGRLHRVTKNPPVKVLTKMQKMWLRSKLSDPRIRLFMDDDAISRMELRLADVPPVCAQDDIRYFDRFTDCDNFADPSYIANFRAALDAVKKHSIVRIEYSSAHGKSLCGSFVLLKMEYSPKNDKFRAYCFLLHNDRIRRSGILNIGRIISISDTGRTFRDTVSTDEFFQSRKCCTPAVIRVTPARNGVERFMMEFASYEKHTVRDLDSGEYTVELWYDAQDETELLVQLLSFGPVIEILGPDHLREQARQRVVKQFRMLER